MVNPQGLVTTTTTTTGAPTTTTTPAPEPWLTGWDYRKSFPLSRASGAVTDYQIKITVHRSAGSDSGSDVYVGTNCEADYDDIRFTTSDGETLLDYWIEYADSDYATIWVEFDSIGTDATTFYMYYGNAAAAAYSDGEATFPFFDDFNDDSIDTAKWFHWIDNGSEAESGGIFSITGGAGTYNAWGAKTKFGVNYAYRTSVKANSDATESGLDFVIFGIDDRSADGNYEGSGRDSAHIKVSTAKLYAAADEGILHRLGGEIDM